MLKCCHLVVQVFIQFCILFLHKVPLNLSINWLKMHVVLALCLHQVKYLNQVIPVFCGCIIPSKSKIPRAAFCPIFLREVHKNLN